MKSSGRRESQQKRNSRFDARFRRIEDGQLNGRSHSAKRLRRDFRHQQPIETHNGNKQVSRGYSVNLQSKRNTGFTHHAIQPGQNSSSSSPSRHAHLHEVRVGDHQAHQADLATGPALRGAFLQGAFLRPHAEAQLASKSFPDQDHHHRLQRGQRRPTVGLAKGVAHLGGSTKQLKPAGRGCTDKQWRRSGNGHRSMRALMGVQHENTVRRLGFHHRQHLQETHRRCPPLKTMHDSGDVRPGRKVKPHSVQQVVPTSVVSVSSSTHWHAKPA